MEFDEITERLRVAQNQGKMDAMRAQLDAQSDFVPKKFEPNDEPLWSQIRLNVATFMNDLFRKGAFQGNSPKKAYFVKCDNETTTAYDINRGIVNIIVGFAPLKPAEFIILKIQQIAGQETT